MIECAIGFFLKNTDFLPQKSLNKVFISDFLISDKRLGSTAMKELFKENFRSITAQVIGQIEYFAFDLKGLTLED
jgi:hypothetical protein